jgi:hypothetical protein
MYDDCNLKIDTGDWKGFTIKLRRRFVVLDFVLVILMVGGNILQR